VGPVRVLTAVIIALVAIDFVTVALRRVRHSGDFDVSMEFGRRFLSGEHLYRGGLHFPYLPSGAMFFAPFSMLPKPLAFALFYSIAIIGLWLVMRMMAAMVCQANPAVHRRRLPIAMATLILASHYIIRDLDDGGPNIILLTMAVGGIYLAWKGDEGPAAGCLGAAAAFKATAGIFIPFLLWKRRWRLAAYTIAAAAFWITLPMLMMGPASWWAHQQEWLYSAVGFALGSNQAAAYYYGADNIGNQALRPAINHLAGGVRYAGTIATTSALLLIGIFCWLTRRPYRESLGAAWLTETSGLLLIAVLLAPIAWVQHLVLAIPALYLIAADWFTTREFGFPATVAMVSYAIFALALNRGLLGKARYSILLDYHVHTLCMLLILAVLMLRYAGEHERARLLTTTSR
jgi:Glycosyltransferase family 87